MKGLKQLINEVYLSIINVKIIRMKVLRDFYCRQEDKSYFEGDNYNGKRTDLIGFVGYPIPKEKKVKRKSKK